MDMQKLREANVARQKERDASGKTKTRTYLMMALLGEVGELANVVKKLHREQLGVSGSRATMAELEDEVADCVIYLDLLVLACSSTWSLNTKEVFKDERVIAHNGRLDEMQQVAPLLTQQMAVVALGRTMGELCAAVMTAAGKDPGWSSAGLDTRLAALLGALMLVARLHAVDEDVAVPRKFNADSVKFGCTTRLVLTAGHA